MLVSLLAEQSLLHEFFAETSSTACLGTQLNPYHQPSSANLFDGIALDLFQLRLEIIPHGSCIFDHSFFNQHFEGRAGHRASQRVAAESTAVVAGHEYAQYLTIG